MSVLIDAKDLPAMAGFPADAARTIETIIPGTLSAMDVVVSVSRGEGAGVLLASPEPGQDPKLDVFVAGDVQTELASPLPEYAPAEGAGQVAPLHLSSSSGDHPQAVDKDAVVVVPTSEADALGAALASGPTEMAPDAALPSIAVRERSLLGSSGSRDSHETSEHEPARTSWGMVLLGSYASAMTLAFLWLWWHPRVRVEAPREAESPSDERLARGLRGDRSVKLIPSAPLRKEHITRLGRPIVVDSLEFTPLTIERGSVRLEHLSSEGAVESRDGESGVWILRVRLKNRSKDQIFAPLDEAFIRQRESGAADSFVKLSPDGRIEMYPLAVESEWAIVGQEFRELRPGETLESIVVTEKGASGRETDDMEWRVRLRTSADRTEVVGVSLRKDDVK
jgi:hypothetical protein